jgi:hypothetical protein
MVQHPRRQTSSKYVLPVVYKVDKHKCLVVFNGFINYSLFPCSVKLGLKPVRRMLCNSMGSVGWAGSIHLFPSYI